jgi:hypothetical protein
MWSTYRSPVAVDLEALREAQRGDGTSSVHILLPLTRTMETLTQWLGLLIVPWDRVDELPPDAKAKLSGALTGGTMPDWRDANLEVGTAVLEMAAKGVNDTHFKLAQAAVAWAKWLNVELNDAGDLSGKHKVFIRNQVVHGWAHSTVSRDVLDDLAAEIESVVTAHPVLIGDIELELSDLAANPDAAIVGRARARDGSANVDLFPFVVFVVPEEVEVGASGQRNDGSDSQRQPVAVLLSRVNRNFSTTEFGFADRLGVHLITKADEPIAWNPLSLLAGLRPAKIQRKSPRAGLTPLAATTLVGRDEELDEALRRIHEQAGGRLFVLEGEAGGGKSAFMAEVARRLAEELDDSCLLAGGYFRRDSGQHSPGSVLGNLLRQLGAEPVDMDDVSGEDQLVEESVSNLRFAVKARTGAGQRSIVLLDALDECEEWFSNGQAQRPIEHLMRHLRRLADDGAVVVVSYRVEGSDFAIGQNGEAMDSHLRGTHSGLVVAGTGHSENIVESEPLLTARLPRLTLYQRLAVLDRKVGDRASRLDPGVLRSAADKSGGLPLYLEAIGQDLRHNPLALRTEGLPDTLNQYFDRLLKRAENASHSEVSELVLSVLAFTGSAVTREVLVALVDEHLKDTVAVLPVPDSTVQVTLVLRSLAAVLEAEAGDSVRLFHGSFGDFLRRPSQGEAHRRGHVGWAKVWIGSLSRAAEADSGSSALRDFALQHGGRLKLELLQAVGPSELSLSDLSDLVGWVDSEKIASRQRELGPTAAVEGLRTSLTLLQNFWHKLTLEQNTRLALQRVRRHHDAKVSVDPLSLFRAQVSAGSEQIDVGAVVRLEPYEFHGLVTAGLLLESALNPQTAPDLLENLGQSAQNSPPGARWADHWIATRATAASLARTDNSDRSESFVPRPSELAHLGTGCDEVLLALLDHASTSKQLRADIVEALKPDVLTSLLRAAAPSALAVRSDLASELLRQRPKPQSEMHRIVWESAAGSEQARSQLRTMLIKGLRSNPEETLNRLFNVGELLPLEMIIADGSVSPLPVGVIVKCAQNLHSHTQLIGLPHLGRLIHKRLSSGNRRDRQGKQKLTGQEFALLAMTFRASTIESRLPSTFVNLPRTSQKEAQPEIASGWRDIGAAAHQLGLEQLLKQSLDQLTALEDQQKYPRNKRLIVEQRACLLAIIGEEESAKIAFKLAIRLALDSRLDSEVESFTLETLVLALTHQPKAVPELIIDLTRSNYGRLAPYERARAILIAAQRMVRVPDPVTLTEQPVPNKLLDRDAIAIEASAALRDQLAELSLPKPRTGQPYDVELDWRLALVAGSRDLEEYFAWSDMLAPGGEQQRALAALVLNSDKAKGQDLMKQLRSSPNTRDPMKARDSGFWHERNINALSMEYCGVWGAIDPSVIGEGLYLNLLSERFGLSAASAFINSSPGNMHVSLRTILGEDPRTLVLSLLATWLNGGPVSREAQHHLWGISASQIQFESDSGPMVAIQVVMDSRPLDGLHRIMRPELGLNELPRLLRVARGESELWSEPDLDLLLDGLGGQDPKRRFIGNYSDVTAHSLGRFLVAAAALHWPSRFAWEVVQRRPSQSLVDGLACVLAAISRFTPPQRRQVEEVLQILGVDTAWYTKLSPDDQVVVALAKLYFTCGTDMYFDTVEQYRSLLRQLGTTSVRLSRGNEDLIRRSAAFASLKEEHVHCLIEEAVRIDPRIARSLAQEFQHLPLPSAGRFGLR